jgi:hypothetical protein
MAPVLANTAAQSQEREVKIYEKPSGYPPFMVVVLGTLRFGQSECCLDAAGAEKIVHKLSREHFEAAYAKLCESRWNRP